VRHLALLKPLGWFTQRLSDEAGSETARRWPTYIEGAIESGFRAARETADLLAA
jgi:monoamine oxidase